MGIKGCLGRPVLINEAALFSTTRIGAVSGHAKERSEAVVAFVSAVLTLIKPPNSPLCLWMLVSPFFCLCEGLRSIFTRE